MANMQWADRIGRHLKLRDLHVLFAVMQSGSMAKAARHLAVSQPVVSAAIAGLEQTLGVRLLDRSRRGVEPTIYGRALLNHGLAAFDALRQGVKEIEFLADPTAGELLIGCPEWIAAGLLRSSPIGYCNDTHGWCSTSNKPSRPRRNFANCASGVWIWCSAG